MFGLGFQEEDVLEGRRDKQYWPSIKEQSQGASWLPFDCRVRLIIWSFNSAISVYEHD